MEVMWPETDPKSSRRSLHQAIYALRRALQDVTPGPTHVLYEDGSYLLNPDLELWLDAVEFETLAVTGRHLESAGRLDAAATQLVTADRLYRGDFLEESPYDEWTTTERERLRMLYLDTAWRLAELLYRKKLYVDALTVAQRVLTFDPCNEEASRLIMRTYAAQGQRDLAIKQFRICEERLKRELDVAPSTETVELLRRLG